jgi:glycosyltransferase involved in cell wall biosynthesis
MMANADRRPRVDFLVGERNRPRDAMDRSYTNFKTRLDAHIDGRELDYVLPDLSKHMTAMTPLSRFPYGVKAWLKRREDSIVQIHNQRLGMILHLNDFSPSVIICYDIIEYLMPEYWPTAAHKAFVRTYLTGTMNADVVLTPSARTAEDIKKSFKPKRVQVIQHGVDRTHFHPVDRRVFLKHFGLPEERRYMLYVGSEQPRKNVPMVVRTFIKARKEFPDLALIKVGRAEEILGHPVREQLLKELSSAGLADQALFLDFVPDGFMAAAYSAADVFVFPSLYEGFGMPVLEAMACGTPVVASNTTAIPEVAGDAAILVPPTDEDSVLAAVSRVLRDSELRADLSVRGQHRAEQFNWDKSAKELLSLYRQLDPRSG